MAIWSKGDDTTDRLVHDFTVGDDWVYDRVLAPYDLLGCLAHAHMLAKVGLVAAADGTALIAALRALHRGWEAGEWTVEAADEDVHSKIEALLTERLGDAGKRLHTGRSRNDQVLTAIRLWQKQAICANADRVLAAVTALLNQATRYEFHPLPGYTHLQRAMPSSVGMFFAAHADALLEDLILLEGAYRLADRCPLGSGASYGVGLPLDRAYAAGLLGFERHSGVAMADANSRGRTEVATLDALGAVINDLSRLAADVVFFTTSECGFFTLGKGFTTGSSIMPQKRNPDLFELLRGRAARFLGLRTGLNAMTLGLASGYSRDLQDTKALLIDGVRLAEQGLAVIAKAIPSLEPVRERILTALTPEVYATDEAYRLMRETGIPFREAYIQVGRDLAKLTAPDHDATVRSRTHAGSTGNLGLAALKARHDEASVHWSGRGTRMLAVWRSLLGD